jgi:hypothetical protein
MVSEMGWIVDIAIGSADGIPVTPAKSVKAN